MKLKIRTMESVKPLISESGKQGIINHRNQRITQSTNQPIKFGIPTKTRALVSKFNLRLLPGEGKSNPKTQTQSGGGLIASASGIGKNHPPSLRTTREQRTILSPKMSFPTLKTGVLAHVSHARVSEDADTFCCMMIRVREF